MSSTASDFLLIDCNAFYVSCERVFNPKLKNRACVVLSSNDGCVVARSNEAKQMGIPMGAPYFQYKTIFEKQGGVALSSNYALYADMSKRVMEILHTFCKKVDVYSIDEAFVEIDEKEETLVPFLIDTIKKWTGIPVTIGRAKTKTLAKLASDQAKKRQLPYLKLIGNIDPILAKTPVSDIWGIGKKITKLLGTLNIITALDLKNTPGYILKKHHSVLLEKTALELAGLACLEIQEEAPSKKSITYSRSFGAVQTSFDDVYAALSFYIQKASKKLRDQESFCKQMVVFINTSAFDKDPYINSIFIELPTYTNDTSYLIQCGGLLLSKIFIEGKNYKKVGVILLGLIEEKFHTQDLFEIKNPKKKEALKVFDSINQKYGCEKIEYASSRLNDKFHRLAEKKSASFTTSWDDLLEVN